MYDEEKFAQLEQSPGRSRGEFIYGAFELLLDPETIVFGVLAFFVMGVYAVVRLILEGFSGGPPQGLSG